MIDLLRASVIDSSLRVIALAAAVAVVLSLFRIRSSSTRHAAWSAVTLTMLLMPLLTRVAPPFYVTVPERLEGMASSVPPPADVPPTLITEPLPVVSTDAAGATPVLGQTPIAGNDPAMPRSGSAPEVRWSVAATAIYTIGVAVLLIRFLVGVSQLLRIRRNSTPVAPELFESSLVATPVTIGLFAPRIILPTEWREWAPETLAAVLAHERAHVSRRDPLTAVAAHLNCVLFWFHPLAWWLERRLAMLAEHACDDAAVKHVAPGRYAETLLDIAANVRRYRGRLVWQGVGVDGNGRLGQRIDRVLNGSAPPEPSRARRVLVAVSCAAAMMAAIACQQQRQEKIEPLREDPELAAELKAQRDRQVFYESAQKMSIDEAAALENLLEQNPEDLVTREQLLTFYRWTGKNAQPWNDNVVARRRHALWLVEHHPDSGLLTSVRLSKREDPQGYAHARATWLTAIERSDADERILSNAAYFFQESEKSLAEEILLRAKTQYPDGPRPRVASGTYYPSWSRRLGDLYASAMVGMMGSYRTDENPATQAWGRDRLERSSDGQVLHTAGIRLVYWPSKPEQRTFGKELIMRASQLESPAKESARDWLRRSAPQSRLEERLATNATGGERLRQLASQAESEYLNAEYSDWRARQSPDHLEYSGNPKLDLEKAAAAFGRSKGFAQQALDLAPSLTETPDYPTAVFRAHMAAGLNAFREGRRDQAVAHLLEASKTPTPKEPAPEPRSLLEYRLVNYLLKRGERATIIEYLERSAPARERASRDSMLKAAAAIRKGRMPEHYQRLLASGAL